MWTQLPAARRALLLLSWIPVTLIVPAGVAQTSHRSASVRAANRISGTSTQRSAVIVDGASQVPLASGSCGGTFNAIADASVSQSQPDTAFGSDQTLRVEQFSDTL